MKKLILGAVFAMSTVLAAECTAVYGDGTNELTLATGSPGELGLVEALANEFVKDRDAKLCWIKAGSGKSLSLLKDKDVNMIMVHAPEAEIKAVKEGWAKDRVLIGTNEFYIIGPKSDPAGIRNAKNVVEAYRIIANTQSPFYTRADNSGTHKKELSIWEMSGIKPSGEWYKENKDFMLATLLKADENGVYFMTDSSTWAAAIKDIKNSDILFRGDVYLVNTYSALRQNSDSTLGDKLAGEFIEFVVSKDGQEIIGNFGKDRYLEPLYNDAEYARKYFIAE